ncbi:MAG: radical SAM family heme chaperone HemW [Acidobacteria bacterium]|nr:radical SAM family heme chaperone HemW [Acidobacteriota bacterium]
MAGLYVHVPFCAAICHYCNFTRGLLDEAVKARYVKAIVADIRRHPRDLPVASVFFGGGTPSLLTPAEVGAIVDAVRDSFCLSPDAEVTLEANPESVTANSAAGYLAAGVTRVSLGVQSFRDDELARLGRLHSAARAVAAVGELRAAGVSNISLDLMLWLPEQTRAHLGESIARLIDVGPEHASVYLLEVYANSPLKDSMARGGWAVASDDEAADMYLETMAALERAGYRQYEISNVARPGRESVHNLTYWQDGDWFAFGAGAHGAVDDVRWRVVSGTGDYIARVEAGGDVVAERWPRDDAARCEEALFMGLRLAGGVDVARIAARYGVDVWARYGSGLQPFVEAGHLVHEPGRRIFLTRPGMLVANDAMAVFLDSGMR